MTVSSASKVDIHGPVFISYRQSDGSNIAAEVARILRASGVPVWRDKNDLPPGDTEERLKEAFAAGISGAVLIVTPEINQSVVVRNTELPELLELHRSSDFALQIINAVLTRQGSTDYEAPDSLLRRTPGDLQGIDQQPASTEGMRAVSAALAEVRVNRHRYSGSGTDPMGVSVQTRNVGRAADRTDAVLDLRFEGGEDRLPAREALDDLKELSLALPTLVTISGAGALDIQGGAHLSIAFALGASIPVTRVSKLRVRQDSSTDWWGPASPPAQSRDSLGIDVKRASGDDPAGGNVAVFIDLIENPDSDRAFENFWGEHLSDFVSRLVMKRTARSWLTPPEGTVLANEVMKLVREEWGREGNGVLHLFLRVPFPMAVLLGHLSNTLECVLYEWGTTEYAPTLQVKSGSGSGTVKAVLLAS